MTSPAATPAARTCCPLAGFKDAAIYSACPAGCACHLPDPADKGLRS